MFTVNASNVGRHTFHAGLQSAIGPPTVAIRKFVDAVPLKAIVGLESVPATEAFAANKEKLL